MDTYHEKKHKSDGQGNMSSRDWALEVALKQTESKFGHNKTLKEPIGKPPPDFKDINWREKSHVERENLKETRIETLKLQVSEAKDIISSVVDYIDYLSRQQPVDKTEKALTKDMIESLTDILGELPAWVSTTTK